MYFKPRYDSDSRRSQSLSNQNCQTILYKAVFEHFIEIEGIAALLLASKSFQNSSFGANFVVNFVVDEDSIRLMESVLSPSSCFSIQFVPLLHIGRYCEDSEEVNRGVTNFVGELVKTKYLHSSLRSLTLNFVRNEIPSFFFGSSSAWPGSRPWPQLRELNLDHCRVNDTVLEVICTNAPQLRTVNFSENPDITDAGLQSVDKLSHITSLNLTYCDKITDLGLESISKLSNITWLNLHSCKKITDAGLEHLSKLADITALDLANCEEIKDAGLEHLSKLSRIRFLKLSYCNKITDAGLEHLSKLAGIKKLDLGWCNEITDVGLEHLSKLAGITSLILVYCDKITDAGLEYLAKLPRITFLLFHKSDNITDSGKKKFEIDRPNCSITMMN